MHVKSNHTFKCLYEYLNTYILTEGICFPNGIPSVLAVGILKEFLENSDAICKILTGKLEILIGQKSRGIQVLTKTGNSDLHTLRPLKLLCLHIPPCSGLLLILIVLDPQFSNHLGI